MGCVDCAPGTRPKDWRRWAVVVVGAAGIAFSIWRGATGTNKQLVLYQRVEKIAFSTDGKRLIAVGGSRAVAWDVETWNELPPGITLPIPVDPAFSPDGKRRAVSGHVADQPEVRVLDVLTGKELVKKKFKSRVAGGVVHAVALGPRWLAVAFGNSEKTDILLWDVGR